MEIIDEVRSFIAVTFYAPSDLSADDSLLEAGILDSTGVLEVIAHVEKRYGIEVGDREIHPDNFDSVARIAAYIERKRREAARAAPESRP